MDTYVESNSIPRPKILSPTALYFPVNDNGNAEQSPVKLPRRLRRRLLESKSSSPTAQDIEAKLSQAQHRRQQFYELLSRKAGSKSCSAARSFPHQEGSGQRLKAKLHAAEQKRLGILAKIQKRLSRLDELRQAARRGVELRMEKKRADLGAKVETRGHQAEQNRLLVISAHGQRMATKKERMAQVLRKRLIQESRHKECVWAAICNKQAAAEKKRLELLETEKSRSQARALLVECVCKAVNSKREIERRKLKNKLEHRLRRAKRLRTEFLRKKADSHSPACASQKEVDHGDLLSSKLSRCWREFVREKGTTVSLAKAYRSLGINEKSVKVMPFEQLAPHLNSSATIQTAKALLDRFESRLTIEQAIIGANKLSMLQNIDHLLKHVSLSPGKRATLHKITKNRRVKGVGSGEVLPHFIKSSRYPVRVVLCAYMILGHPDAVFSGKGEYENTLAESAKAFVQEYELLIKIILDRPIICSTEINVSSVQCPHSFRSQLERFDKAWCSYLYCFVTWKVKDVKLLEEDLVRAACELEVKKIEMRNQSPDKDCIDIKPEKKAFQEKVTENLKLLQANLQYLSGNAGVECMELALSGIRSHYIGAKAEKLSTSSDTNFSAQSSAHLSPVVETNGSQEDEIQDNQRVRHLRTVEGRSTCSELGSETPRRATGIHLTKGLMSVTENEVLVNEIVHGHKSGLIDRLSISTKKQENVKALVGNTMDKAFWDAVLESMKQNEPDYSWVLKLMKEVQDELFEMSPSNWRQEIIGTCDTDILSQVLNSGTVDMDYLGRILGFTMDIILKLSAPVKENELKIAYKKFQEELNGIAQAGERTDASFAFLVTKGLRFVLQQIQLLKQDISKARIRLLEPLIKGPAGLEYLRNTFTTRYRAPIEAPASLPLVGQWLAEVIPDSEGEWKDHLDSFSALSSQGLPATLQAGGSILKAATVISRAAYVAGSELSECEGEKIDLYLRLGLLKLVSEVDGLKFEKLPETLKLNFSRLRIVQSKLQKFTFICSSLLVLRQTLLSDQLVTSSAEMENIISKCATRLFEFIDSKEDVGVSEIIEVMNSFSNNDDLDKCQSRKEVMLNMLVKSLRAGDGVFARISRTVYLAARGIVLGGSGAKGRQLAETVLKRIGAATLADKLIEAIEDLVAMANLSGCIHRAWYEKVLKNLQ